MDLHEHAPAEEDLADLLDLVDNEPRWRYHTLAWTEAGDLLAVPLGGGEPIRVDDLPD